MRKYKFFFLITVFIHIFHIDVYSQQIEKQIQNIVKEYNIVSLQVISIENSSVDFMYCYGKKNIKKKLDVDCNTIYRIASVSKLFTSLAIIKLIDESLISLDDDISVFFDKKIRNPKYPDIPIRIRHLLTHTSGIQEANGPYRHFVENIFKKGSIPITDYILPGSLYYTKYVWKDSSPEDNDFNYSNYCYGLLATIVEKVSNIEFDEYISSNILKPLNIIGGFSLDKIKDKDNIGVLYSYNGEKHIALLDTPETINKNMLCEDYTSGTNALIFSPQGGMRTNIRGLGNFIIEMLNKNSSFLSKKTHTLFHTTLWKNKDNKGIYREKSAGLHITEDLIPGDRLYGHSGESFGMTSCLYYSLQKRKGFAFIVTGGNYRLGKTGFYEHEEKLVDILFKK